MWVPGAARVLKSLVCTCSHHTYLPNALPFWLKLKWGSAIGLTVTSAMGKLRARVPLG